MKKDNFQAEYDADVMARYQEIMASPERQKAAAAIAKKRIAQMEKSLNSMKKVAGAKQPKKTK